MSGTGLNRVRQISLTATAGTNKSSRLILIKVCDVIRCQLFGQWLGVRKSHHASADFYPYKFRIAVLPPSAAIRSR